MVRNSIKAVVTTCLLSSISLVASFQIASGSVPSINTSYSYTGSMVTYTVPANTCSFVISASGGAGGPSIWNSSAHASSGGTAQGTFDVGGSGNIQPGDSLGIYVAQSGQPFGSGGAGWGFASGGSGPSGGTGGGGASGVFDGSQKLLEAGGGGGASYNVAGGAGGVVGINNGYGSQSSGEYYGGVAATAGTNAPGVGAQYPAGSTGSNGSDADLIGNGGNGASGSLGGSGGGGGYFGGGGGYSANQYFSDGFYELDSAGAGGSSWVSTLATSTGGWSGVDLSGDGHVEIDAFVCPSALSAADPVTLSIQGSVPTVGNNQTFTASSLSGATVSVTSSTSSVCSVTGSSLSALSTGTCTLVGSVDATSGYAADSATLTFSVSNPVSNPVLPSDLIGWVGTQTPVLVGRTFVVAAAAMSGTAVTFANYDGTNACSLAPAGTTQFLGTTVWQATVTAVSVGPCEIEATTASSNTYLGGALVTVYSILAAPVVKPGVPRALRVKVSKSNAVVSWTAPTSTGGGTITGYRVTTTPGNAGCTTIGALTCTIHGLKTTKKYTFSVVAINSAGSGPKATKANVTG